MIALKQLEQSLLKALVFIRDEIIKELKAQGHVASGNLINSIELKTEIKADKVVGSIIMEDYAIYLDKGVKRVPYSRGSGAGTSRYIQALIDWISIIKPSMGLTEKKSFAFAIANKAKQEGHPTRGSYAYSSNGRRKEWAKYAIQGKEREIERLLSLGDFIAASISSFVADIDRFKLIL